MVRARRAHCTRRCNIIESDADQCKLVAKFWQQKAVPPGHVGARVGPGDFALCP